MLLDNPILNIGYGRADALKLQAFAERQRFSQNVNVTDLQFRGQTFEISLPLTIVPKRMNLYKLNFVIRLRESFVSADFFCLNERLTRTFEARRPNYLATQHIG